MLDLIKRFRETAAWLVIAVVTATMILSVAEFAQVLLVSGSSGIVTVGQAALRLAGSTVSLGAALMLLAIVTLCVFGVGSGKASSRRAPTITNVSAVMISLGVVEAVVFDVFGVAAMLDWGATGWGEAAGSSIVFEVLRSMTDLVLKLLVAAALWVLVRGQKLGVAGSPLAANTPSRHSSAPGVPVTSPAAASPNAPSISVSGAGWRDVNEAARGVPAASRGADRANRQWRLVMHKRDEET